MGTALSEGHLMSTTTCDKKNINIVWLKNILSGVMVCLIVCVVCSNQYDIFLLKPPKINP